VNLLTMGIFFFLLALGIVLYADNKPVDEATRHLTYMYQN